MPYNGYEINVPGAGETRKSDALLSNSGLLPFEITFTATASADASLAATETVPANGVVLGYRVTCKSAGSLTTATHVSVGYSGDPDELAEIASASFVDAGDTSFAILATPNTAMAGSAPQLTATNGSGAAAGNITTGTYVLTVWGYDVQEHGSLPS